ncbi:FAD-dependent oxidoreductase [Pontibacillus halophilus JSM 076056 = DSM 19796]|uniref:FAD-dependent oxidoreductase n=1 Tax=Pontibacillus halophilus JSM 076056 = DSM 19796 TaxID=1385510 RepID=A0A0A5GKH0_9BACI|nr:FAD-dependent oxidoreductase [Pontibacillus halophilus JSM 076056 = DSM 19796]
MIIGGGLSGVMAARTLLDKGVEDVCIVEKSKGVGGRLATRRINGGKADHGAQFFTVRTQSFQEDVTQWLDKGWVKPWFGDSHWRYTSVDGMNQLVKRLAEGLNVLPNAKVTRLIEGAGGFDVELEDGRRLKAGGIILTAPAPQASELLRSSSITYDRHTFRQLSQIDVGPAFVGLFELNRETTFSEDGHIDTNLPDGVERIVDHSLKGVSEKPIVSVYMKMEWSNHHFEEKDEELLTYIKYKIEEYVPSATIVSEQLKRWKYAQSHNVVRRPCVNVHEALPLYVAGDSFLHEDDDTLRTRVESAYLSGVAAGEATANFVG